MIAYVVTNLVNRKRYIGISSAIDHTKRWREHLSAARSSKPRAHLHNAISKTGPASFSIETVASARTWEDLCAVERTLIAQYNTFRDTGLGYNLTLGGWGSGGMSAESRSKISAAIKGKPKSAGHIAALSKAAAGRKATDETKMRISAAGRGRRRSAEFCLASSARQVGKPKWSAEQRAAMSAVRIGRRPTQESIAKTAAANRGRPLSESHRVKIGLAHKGKEYSVDRKAKISLMMRGRRLTPEHRAAISAGGIGKKMSDECLRKRALTRRLKSIADSVSAGQYEMGL